MQLNLNQVIDATKKRPSADHAVEQYLMTSESLYHQITHILPNIGYESSVLLLGDDDHLSIFLAQHVTGQVVVIENDPRIITSLRQISLAQKLANLRVVPHDLRELLPKTYNNKFDYCILNPPYSSKNNGFGIKVWLSRALSALKIDGTGLLILPIYQSLDWSMKNYLTIQSFLADLHSPIIGIDRDVHTYEDLPDQGLTSSNVWFVKLEDASVEQGLISVVHKQKSLYR